VIRRKRPRGLSFSLSLIQLRIGHGAQRVIAIVRLAAWTKGRIGCTGRARTLDIAGGVTIVAFGVGIGIGMSSHMTQHIAAIGKGLGTNRTLKGFFARVCAIVSLQMMLFHKRFGTQFAPKTFFTSMDSHVSCEIGIACKTRITQWTCKRPLGVPTASSSIILVCWHDDGTIPFIKVVVVVVGVGVMMTRMVRVRVRAALVRMISLSPATTIFTTTTTTTTTVIITTIISIEHIQRQRQVQIQRPRQRRGRRNRGRGRRTRKIREQKLRQVGHIEPRVLVGQRRGHHGVVVVGVVGSS